MRRVLVTGANGQLGKCIQEVSDDFDDLEFKFHNSETFDITDFNKVSSLFSEGNFEYCINCAAYTNVEEAEKTPKKAYAVNSEGVGNLATSCQKHKVILIHMSTDYVFDGEKEEGYTVHDIPNPINVYGKSKLAGEQEVQRLLNDFFIIRTSWLYSEYGKNFYKSILNKAKTEKTLYVTDEQTGCPTHASNLAQYILHLIVSKNTNFGVHHFTDGEAMTWYDFASRILNENEMDVTIVATDYPTVAKRPKYSVLKMSR